MRAVFTEVLTLNVPGDRVVFDIATLNVGFIREDQEYGGIRVGLIAKITNAQMRLQIDVGFGDAITPAAKVVEFPALLEFPAPLLRAYPRETVIAEKLEAMVHLGMANSRMKDFFDIALLSRMFDFDGEVLATAIRATFERRPDAAPERPTRRAHAGIRRGCNKAHAVDRARKAGASGDVRDLAATIAEITAFAAKPFAIAASGAAWGGGWPAGGPWAP